MSKFAPPPGTSDIFPAESYQWRFLEETAADIFARYNFGELRTPIFEYTEVFHRGLGSETEVVRKEMYTFEDRGGRSLTLRPEGTAGVMRSLLNTDVLNGVEQRVYYHGPMFRGERPAAGRKRQFHQIGAENVGRIAPELDAETVAMLMDMLNALGINDAELIINTRGVTEDRTAASAVLLEYFTANINNMCDDCKARLSGNIWRILDCKQEQCRKFIDDAPDYLEFFTQDSKDYFNRVLQALDALGVKYRHDPLLVRGLDYYVHTVFEVTHWGLGGQNAIAGGGRYELFLPEQSRPVIGVGFAAGMERLIMAQQAANFSVPQPVNNLIYLVALGENARLANLSLAAKLRASGLTVVTEVENKSMKAQMRTANRISARVALISGDDELAEQRVLCRDMSSSEQESVAIADVVEKCIDIINKN